MKNNKIFFGCMLGFILIVILIILLIPNDGKKIIVERNTNVFKDEFSYIYEELKLSNKDYKVLQNIINKVDLTEDHELNLAFFCNYIISLNEDDKLCYDGHQYALYNDKNIVSIDKNLILILEKY